MECCRNIQRSLPGESCNSRDSLLCLRLDKAGGPSCSPAWLHGGFQHISSCYYQHCQVHSPARSSVPRCSFQRLPLECPSASQALVMFSGTEKGRSSPQRKAEHCAGVPGILCPTEHVWLAWVFPQIPPFWSSLGCGSGLGIALVHGVTV